MKHSKTVLNELSKNSTNIHSIIVKLLITLNAYSFSTYITDTILKLNNSLLSLMEQELIEFKESFEIQLSTNVESDFNKNVKIFMNSAYEYNFDFYFTDYKDSLKTINSILDSSESIHYLSSNLYTVIASYIRMQLLFKILNNLNNSTIDNYNKCFYFSKYKSSILTLLNSLNEESN